MQLEDNTIQITLILCVYVMRINSYFYSLLCFMHESSTCVIYIPPPFQRAVVPCRTFSGASGSVHLYKQYTVCNLLKQYADLCVIIQLVCQSNKAAYIALK